jgi:hypothetical protein
MTTTQKTILTAAIAVAIGTSVLSLYEARRAADLRSQTERLQQEQEPLNQQVEQLRKERDDAQKQITQLRRDNAALPRLRGEVTRLQAETQESAQLKAAEAGRGTVAQTQTATDPAEAAAKAWAAKVNQLKQAFEQMPDKQIPELQFLAEDDWLYAARTAKLETEVDVRTSLSSLRRTAKSKFSGRLGVALGLYAEANGGQLPADVSQLAPYFQPPVEDAILQRYQMVRTGPIGEVARDNLPVVEKAPVDEQYDTLISIGPGIARSQGVGSLTGQTTVQTWRTPRDFQ